MSRDTYMQLRTPLTAAEVRAALVRDPALADLGLVDPGDWTGMGSDRVGLSVKPWEWDEEELEVLEGGFGTATVWVSLQDGRGAKGWEDARRVVAAILRLVPGDACLADGDAAGPGLLRLGGVVYVNPDWIGPEDLTDFGYHPERIVEGIPPGLAVAAAAA